MGNKNLKIYKASAGSGKTDLLTKQYIQYLIDDYKLDSQPYKKILAVTFTNAATAEMKERIIEYLYKDAKENRTKRELLNKIVHDYSMFRVTTIDKFFQSILRSFALEMGKRSSYELVVDESEAIDESLNGLYKSIKNKPDLVATLEGIALSDSEENKSWDFRKRLREFCKQIMSPSFLKVKRDEPSLFSKEGMREFDRLRDKMQKYCIDFTTKAHKIFNQMGRYYAESELDANDFVKKLNSPVFKFLESAKNSFMKGDFKCSSFGLPPLPPVTLDDRFFALYEENKAWEHKQSKNPEKVNALRERLVPEIERYKDLFTKENGYEYFLSYILILKKIRESSLLADIYETLKDYCEKEGIALLSESDDLIHTLIAESDAPFIYEKFGTQIKHFLLDEFQDTSDINWDNFKPLLNESLSKNYENLIVGDVKQSIYRFRGGDWEILNSFDQKDSGNLNTNYRSLAKIVEFNNYIFERLPQKIDSTVDEEIKRRQGKNTLSRIYENCSQKVSSENLEKLKMGHGGFVKVISHEHGKNFIFKDDFFIRKKTLQIIKSLTEENREGTKRYKRGQIAILVTTREKGKEIMKYLMANDIKVVSKRADQIDSSDAVFALLVLIRYLVNKEKIRIDLLETLYNIEFRNKEILSEISLNESLYDICQKLIADHLPNSLKNDVIFLSAFIDKVLEYSANEGSDLSGFLLWWNNNRESEEFTVPTPESDDAVVVMTMHKAKGLAFDVVILPYIRDFPPKKNKQDGSHWVQFSEPSFLYEKRAYIDFRDKQITQTVFKKDFEKVKYNQAIESVNLLYVSATRAREKLYLFDMYGSNENSISTSIFQLCSQNSSFSANSYSISASNAEEYGFRHDELEREDGADYNVAEFTFGIEDEDVIKRNKSNDISSEIRIESLVTNKLFGSIKKELRLREFDSVDDSRYKGILYHILYSYLNEYSVKDAVNKLIAENPSYIQLGMTKEELIAKVESDLAGVVDREWFGSSRYKVYTERDILFKGQFYRPDRVLISSDGSKKEAVVIDYKFGDKKNGKYNSQVKRYCKLLREMGFIKVTGYIWYLALKEIEEV